MLTITAENIHEFVHSVRPLRANQEKPSLSTHDKEICNTVGCCCARTKKVFLGALFIEGRQVDIFACPCCRQLFKQDAETPVQGTVENFFHNLIAKHGSFQITLNSAAAKLGVPAAHH